MTQQPRPASHCRGFTLIELLIGSTVLCMVLTLMFSALWFSVRSWDSAERRRDSTHTLALVQSTLAQQLRQARPLFQTDSAGRRVIAFEGDNRRFSYIAPLSRRDGALYLNTVFVAEKADGSALRLRYVPWQPERTFNSGVDTRAAADNTIELLPDIQGINIAYFGAFDAGGEPVWQPTWTQTRSLPERIHIRITASGAGTGVWPDLVICLDGGADCLIPATYRPAAHTAAVRGHHHGS